MHQKFPLSIIKYSYSNMTNIDLARQAVCQVEGVSFKLSVTSSSDSLCADEWKKAQYFTLSRNQILYQLRERTSHKELFDLP